MNPIRVLIVDDHPIVRQGVRSLLGAFPDMTVVGEADTPTTIFEQIRSVSPDVILLDVNLGKYDGIQMARLIRRDHPNCRVMILTTYNDDGYLYGALEAGAHAYLLKDVSLEDLPAAIRAVHSGKRLLSPLLIDRVLAEFQNLADIKQQQETGLNHVDQQVLTAMADGLTNREIGELLHFSEPTIKKKVQEVLEKLGVANRTQAVALAIRRGLI